MIPISDDNSDRKRIPFVNYIFIAVNILVFVVYQKLGSNLDFTYSYSTVPAEILSGHDIVTAAIWVQDPITGQEVEIPGLGVTAIACVVNAYNIDVYAWGHCSPRWQYALSLDIWR